MIKFDTTMGADYLNRYAREKRDQLKQDVSLMNSKCAINPDCGIGNATIGFEPVPVLKVAPYVKEACCDSFKVKINRKIGSKRFLD